MYQTRCIDLPLGSVYFEDVSIDRDKEASLFHVYEDVSSGIDIAFTKWGQVYHTRYDHPDLLLPGVLQNAGQAVLATLVAAADMDIADKVVSLIHYERGTFPNRAIWESHLFCLIITVFFALYISLSCVFLN
jgi:hypothetical protein